MATLNLYPTSADDSLSSILLKTVHFAAIKHRNQRRKDVDKTPYINHPIGVALILSTQGNVEDPDVLQAALLHDTIEDTSTTLEEVRSFFGDRVASIVDEVTDDTTLSSAERKRKQVESARHKSKEAKLVKLADKIYNLQDLMRQPPVNWTIERVQEYFAWSKKVTDGCKGVNSQLEKILEEIYESGYFPFEGKSYKCLLVG